MVPVADGSYLVTERGTDLGVNPQQPADGKAEMLVVVGSH